MSTHRAVVSQPQHHNIFCICLVGAISTLGGPLPVAFSQELEKSQILAPDHGPGQAPTFSEAEDLPTKTQTLTEQFAHKHKRLIFTFGERKKLVKEQIEKAIALAESAYRQTEDPILRFRVGMKLAKLYTDQSQTLILLSESEYEKTLESYIAGGKKGPAPQAPSHAAARAVEDKALSLLEALRKSGPAEHLDEPLFLLGLIHANRAKYATASAYFTQLLTTYPKSAYAVQAKTMTAEVYYTEGQFPSALQIYEELLAQRPNDLYLIYKKAWTLFNLRQFDTAIGLFLDLYRQTHLETTDAWGRGLGRQLTEDLVWAYVQSQRVDEGLTFIDTLGPDAPSWLYKMALMLIESGFHESARKVCSQLLSRYPDTPLIPSTILTIVETYRPLIHNLAKYHTEITNTLIQSLNRYPPSETTTRLPKSISGYQQLDQWIVKQTQRLHGTGQKWLISEGKESKNERRIAQAHSMLDAAKKYYAVYATYFAPWTMAGARLEMAFFQAELLYQQKGYAAAYAAYQTVIALRKDAKSPIAQKHISDAIYGAVVSSHHLLPTVPTKVAKSTDEPPKEQPLPSQASEFLQAATLYLQERRGDAAYAAVNYQAGKVYYDYNHFPQAIPYFWVTLQMAPKSNEAAFAAHLILDAYNIQKTYGELIQAGKQILVVPELQTRTALLADVQKIVNQAQFKLVEQYEAKQDYVGAAKAYLALGSGGSMLGEKALYNAAVNFQKAKKGKDSITAFEKLIVQYPKSSYKREAIITKAQYHESLGDFARSQESYLLLIPKNGGEIPKANADIVRRIAYVAHVLSDYSTALTYYQRYLPLIPQKDREPIVARMCQVASAINFATLRNIVQTYPVSTNRDAVVRCTFEEARLRLQRGDMLGLTQLKSIRADLAKRIPLDDRERLSSFFDATIVRIVASYPKKKLADVSPTVSATLMKEKLEILKRLKQEVITQTELGVVSSVVFAQKTLATQAQTLASEVRVSRIPEGFGPQELEAYQIQIAQIADTLQKDSQTILSTLISQAAQFEWLMDDFPAIWRMADGQMHPAPTPMPDWLGTITLMPFYIPMTKGSERHAALFPPMMFETFSVAQSATLLPNLSALDPTMQAYFETVVLIGRGDFSGAWAKLMPLMEEDPQNGYLRNLLAYLLAQSGQVAKATLVIELALEQIPQTPFADLDPIFRINEALLTITSGKRYQGLAMLSAIKHQHLYAGLILGYYALKYFNFGWAAQIFYALQAHGVQSPEGPWTTLGLAIAKLGMGDREAAKADFLSLENHSDRSTQLVALAFGIMLLGQESPLPKEEITKRATMYESLKDMDSNRAAWVRQYVGVP